MRIFRIALLLALLLALPVIASALSVDVYYIDPCGGCKEGGCGKCYLERDIFYQYTTLLKPTDAELVMKNIAMKTSLYDERNDRIHAAGFEDISVIGFPTVFIGDAMFSGDGSQDEDILAYIESDGAEYAGYQALVEKHEQDHNGEYQMIFLYSPYCESCKKIERYLTFYVPDWLECVKVSMAEEEGIRWQKALMQRFGLSEDEFFAPSVYYADRLFVGTNEIYLSLSSYLKENPYQQTLQLEDLE